jgi:hypothetical protein
MDETELIEYVAEEMRKTYGLVQGGYMLAHIDDQPWDTLPDDRKYKWLAMAQTAVVLVNDTFVD